MIIIRLMAGLGNQMFQYALYRSFEAKGRDVFIDESWFSKFNAHNGIEIKRVFGVDYRTVDKKSANYLGYADYSLLQRFWQKYLPKKSYIAPDIAGSITFDSRIFQMKDVYLSGYWQSEKYFMGIKDEIRKAFTFNDKNECDLAIKNLICSTESVAVHIRRGDYVNNKLHGNICGVQYYQNAIDFIREKIKAPKFFVFSDDIEWCETNLNLVDAVMVRGNTGTNSYLDMYFMSLCKHNIIANSTFSWWGAWLNANPYKKVVAPSKWFNLSNSPVVDIIPTEWEIINCK